MNSLPPLLSTSASPEVLQQVEALAQQITGEIKELHALNAIHITGEIFTERARKVLQLQSQLLELISRQLQPAPASPALIPPPKSLLPAPTNPSLFGVEDPDLTIVSPSEDDIRMLTHPQFTQVRLVNCTEAFTNQGLVKLTQICPRLTQIEISGSPNINDAGFKALVQGCKGLEVVIIRATRKSPLGTEAFRELAKQCKGLVTLLVDNCPLVGGAALKALGGLPNLKHVVWIESGSERNIHSFAIEAVLKDCKNLTTLVLYKCNTLGGTEKMVFPKQLECLVLPHPSYAIVSKLRDRCPSLQSLQLSEKDPDPTKLSEDLFQWYRDVQTQARQLLANIFQTQAVTTTIHHPPLELANEAPIQMDEESDTDSCDLRICELDEEEDSSHKRRKVNHTKN